MDIEEYKAAVIALFKSGNATDEQWDEMATTVLYRSENEYRSDGVPSIDSVIIPGYDQDGLDW